MPSNPYDQASRYLVRLDPSGMLRWLLPRLPESIRFLGWLETRNIPFPGESDRTGDTVACLEDAADPGPLWAVPIEFQSKPDPEMFGRLLEYEGSFWRQKRPPNRPGEHYQIVSCLVNLTGVGDSHRDYQLAEAHTLLKPGESNLAMKDAAAILTAIAAGQIARCVLPFIPLMQKESETGIITQWQEIARTEPDERKRGDYGGLALVFAELADCRPVWRQALKEWNMQISQQVLEWQAEGEARGALRTQRKNLRKLLEHRFGILPESLLQHIEEIDDMERLQNAFDSALLLQRLEDLQL